MVDVLITMTQPPSSGNLPNLSYSPPNFSKFNVFFAFNPIYYCRVFFEFFVHRKSNFFKTLRADLKELRANISTTTTVPHSVGDKTRGQALKWLKMRHGTKNWLRSHYFGLICAESAKFLGKKTLCITDISLYLGVTRSHDQKFQSTALKLWQYI